MTLHSLEQALADSAALNTLATNTGLTPAQARAVLAWLADMEAPQVVRLCAAAREARIREVNRQTRRTGR